MVEPRRFDIDKFISTLVLSLLGLVSKMTVSHTHTYIYIFVIYLLLGMSTKTPLLITI